MQTTQRMAELMALSMDACTQAGADTRQALASVNKAIDSIDAITSELEEPAERTCWFTVRREWTEIRVLLESAQARFDAKG